MFDLLLRFLKWLIKLWSKIPKKIKDQIVDEILKHFEEILRKFYQWWKGDKK